MYRTKITNDASEDDTAQWCRVGSSSSSLSDQNERDKSDQSSIDDSEEESLASDVSWNRTEVLSEGTGESSIQTVKAKTEEVLLENVQNQTSINSRNADNTEPKESEIPSYHLASASQERIQQQENSTAFQVPNSPLSMEHVQASENHSATHCKVHEHDAQAQENTTTTGENPIKSATKKGSPSQQNIRLTVRLGSKDLALTVNTKKEKRQHNTATSTNTSVDKANTISPKVKVRLSFITKARIKSDDQKARDHSSTSTPNKKPKTKKGSKVASTSDGDKVIHAHYIMIDRSGRPYCAHCGQVGGFTSYEYAVNDALAEMPDSEEYESYISSLRSRARKPFATKKRERDTTSPNDTFIRNFRFLYFDWILPPILVVLMLMSFVSLVELVHKHL